MNMGNNQHPKNCDGAYIQLGNVLADGPLPAAANIITEEKLHWNPWPSEIQGDMIPPPTPPLLKSCQAVLFLNVVVPY